MSKPNIEELEAKFRAEMKLFRDQFGEALTKWADEERLKEMQKNERDFELWWDSLSDQHPYRNPDSFYVEPPTYYGATKEGCYCIWKASRAKEKNT